MSVRKVRLSKISSLHYFKLVFRSCLLLGAVIAYIIYRVKQPLVILDDLINNPIVLGIIWGVFVVEIIFRFFPSKLESMGCQKQFKKNFILTSETKPRLHSWKITLLITVLWLTLNGIFGTLYFFNIIDKGMLLLISLAYSVCDMICILFFCPFQTWFMKNKCCGSCRIYNWDFAMMFTPLIFIPHWYTWSLLGISLLLLITWEISIKIHPERFAENTNACLSCANCQEKLCHHKKQLRGFLKKNRKNLILKGNSTLEANKPLTGSPDEVSVKKP